MAAGLGLKGSFPFSQQSIDREIKRTAPGVFVLGDLSEGKFHSTFIGRSDNDVNKALKQRVGQATRFKVEVFTESERAFAKECELYHRLRPRGNTGHPERLLHSSWRCPACRIFS